MSNNSDWVKAQRTAQLSAGQAVLYCLIFSHGLMKVGRTKNMPSRVEALTAHGVLKPLIVSLVVQPIDKCSSDAEKIALKRFAEISEQHEAEVFTTVDLESAKSVLMAAASMAREKAPKVEPAEEAFDEMTRSSGMYAAMIHLAIDRAKDLGMHDRAAELSRIVNSTPSDQLNEAVRNSLGKSSPL